MKTVFSEAYKSRQDQLLGFITNFERKGKLFGNGVRNKIKLFPLDGKEVNIKSFKVPNAVNKIAYRFFRKSKAERSYSYAQLLLSKGIGTPYPIGFVEEQKGLVFTKSYYISEHQACDLTFRELVQNPDFPEWENILRAFTRFTFKLHENEVEFLDHSPGNTLIRKTGGDLEFYLVDLNRMNFRSLDFDSRMKNFSRLTPKKEMLRIMANEYSKVYERPEQEIFHKMWFYTSSFQEKFRRKKALKKKLKFWKKK